MKMERDLLERLRECDEILIDRGRIYKHMQKVFEPISIASTARGDRIGVIINDLMGSLNGKAAMCFDEARKVLYDSFPELGTYKEAFPAGEE